MWNDPETNKEALSKLEKINNRERTARNQKSLTDFKKINFVDEVRDESNDSIAVEDGISYRIVVSTPTYLAEEMLQEKTNFLQPGTSMIVVKKINKGNCY